MKTERVIALSQKGLSPKEIARKLGYTGAAITPAIREIHDILNIDSNV